MNLNLYPLLNLIPDSQITTYGNLSKLFGLPNHHRYIAQLLGKNNQPDKFPCFKIVNSDGSLGGYNLWAAEKIKRLNKIWVSVQDEQLVNFTNHTTKFKANDYYLSIPLSKKEREVIYQLQKSIQTVLPDVENFINWQPWQTAHLTVYFFGDNPSFNQSQLDILRKYPVDQKFKREYLFSNLDYFKKGSNPAIAFLGISNNFFLQNLKKFINKLQHDLKLKIDFKKDMPLHPHITLFRIKDSAKFKANQNKIESILNSFDLALNLQQLELSANINSHPQIKLISWDLQ